MKLLGRTMAAGLVALLAVGCSEGQNTGPEPPTEDAGIVGEDTTITLFDRTFFYYLESDDNS